MSTRRSPIFPALTALLIMGAAALGQMDQFTLYPAPPGTLRGGGSPTPTPTPGPTPGMGNAINEAISMMSGGQDCSKLGASVNTLAERAVEVVGESMYWSREMSKVLKIEAIEVAWTLLWAIIFAEVTFAGFRLMLGSSIVEQLGLLTTKTFIYLIVSGTVPFPSAPQAPYDTSEGIIRATMFRLMHAGKLVGAQIVKTASHPNVQALPGISGINVTRNIIPPERGRSGIDDRAVWGPPGGGASTPAGRGEPIMYWLAWIGVDNACKYTYDPFGNALIDGLPGQTVNERNEYKYSQASLNARIWGESPEVDNADNASQRVLEKQKVSEDELRKIAGTGAAGTGSEGGVTDFARGMLVAMMPMQMFGIAMSVAGVQIGSLVTVVFAQMSILVGSITAFNLASSIGLAVLPLMYFRMFDKVWSQYLIALGSLGLIPFFFYVLSAVGFVFSTTVFEMLFPLGRPGDASKSLAVVLNDVFFAAVRSTMSSFSLVTNVFGGLFEKTIGWLLIIYLALGRIMFGSAVVAAFVTGGAMFALLAPRFAFRWTSGFGGEDIVEKISEVFNGIQSAVGSGMGQMYSDALGRAGGIAGGFGRGFGSGGK